MKPVEHGDAQDVAVVWHMSLETAQFVMDELPQHDGVTRELRVAVAMAEERQRQEDDTERFGIHIIMVPR